MGPTFLWLLGYAGDPGADGIRRSAEAVVMALVHPEADSGLALLDNRARPRAHARYSENSPGVLVPQTLVQTKRLLIRWSRDLTTVIETLVVPILLLLTLDTVLGRQISTMTGHDALFGSVPMVAVVATISGSSVGAIV